MVRLQLDDQMDAKSLLGAYTCTAVPGEFAWQPGPLTQVRERVSAGMRMYINRQAGRQAHGCHSSQVVSEGVCGQ